MKKRNLLLLGAVLAASAGSLTCDREDPISPSHPPATFDGRTGRVFIPNATVITAGVEYYESAPLRDSSLALVITEDSSLYFYSSKLGNVDALTLDASCKALGHLLHELMPQPTPNMLDFDVTLETGVRLRMLGTDRVECANSLHRWAAVKVTPSGEKTLLSPRRLFKLDIISLFEGDWGDIFSFNRVPRDTVAMGSRFDTYGAIARLFLANPVSMEAIRQGSAVRDGYDSDPTAFSCLQVLDGLDLIFFVVDIVFAPAGTPLREIVGQTLFREVIKISMRSALADVVAQGSSEAIVRESQRRIIPTIAEAIILNAAACSDDGRTGEESTLCISAFGSGPGEPKQLSITAVLIAIIKAIKIIAASTEQVVGVWDEATHLCYDTHIPGGGGTAVWSDGFETYSVGEWPATNWTNSGNSDGYIDGAIARSGTQSFRLYGVVGGYWGALAHRALGATSPWTVECYLRTGAEPIPSGGHQSRATLDLHVQPYWSSGARSLIAFHKDGHVYGPGGQDLGIYQTLTWYKVKVKYEYPVAGQVLLTYWINDVQAGQESFAPASYESGLAYIALVAQAGSVWFDDVSIGR
jgi:hypothetical protein